MATVRLVNATRSQRPGSAAVASLLLIGLLGALGSGRAVAASAGDSPPKDVTITVVDDPAELGEKVNTISLPPAEDEPRQHSAQHGKEVGAERGQDAQQGREVDKPAEHTKPPAEDSQHDVDEKAPSDAESSQQDANEPQQQGPHDSDDPGGL